MISRFYLDWVRVPLNDRYGLDAPVHRPALGCFIVGNGPVLSVGGGVYDQRLL
jgi:hypothetical protein